MYGSRFLFYYGLPILIFILSRVRACFISVWVYGCRKKIFRWSTGPNGLPRAFSGYFLLAFVSLKHLWHSNWSRVQLLRFIHFGYCIILPALQASLRYGMALIHW